MRIVRACGNVDHVWMGRLEKKHQCTVQKFVNNARIQHGHYEHCLLCHGFNPSFLLSNERSLRHVNKLRSALRGLSLCAHGTGLSRASPPKRRGCHGTESKTCLRHICTLFSMAQMVSMSPLFEAITKLEE